MSKIIIIDDARDVHLLLREIFYLDHSVTSAFTLSEASQLIRAQSFELILLDVKMPDGDGFHFCASLQQNSETRNIPVIFITGKSDIADKAIGFSLGAEDYIVKPFNAAEVKLRCEARIRKLDSKKSRDSVVRSGNVKIEITMQKATLIHDGKEESINLTPTGFKLLLYLVTHHDQVFTRDQLISAVWGDGITIVDRTIDTHIGALRKVLRNADFQIQSVHGVGYRLTSKKISKSAPSAA